MKNSASVLSKVATKASPNIQRLWAKLMNTQTRELPFELTVVGRTFGEKNLHVKVTPCAQKSPAGLTTPMAH